MKQVIFVGGTAFSGSTFLQFALANDPKGFACGEVSWLFRPWRADHIDRACACGDPHCSVWPQVLAGGEAQLYQTIFARFPEVEFIIDSSKNPFWIRRQQDRLKRQGIASRHLLIWKTPLEFAYSCKKRNRPGRWDREWINYHRLYVTLMDQWRAVKYADLARDEGPLLEAICSYLDIPYYAGKEAYWEKTHHTLGGNYSARLHLQSKEDAADYVTNSFDKSRMASYRSVYYREVDDPALAAEAAARAAESAQMQALLQLLEAKDLAHSGSTQAMPDQLRFPLPAVLLRRAKDLVRTQVGRYRYGSSISASPA
ncbi:MAG: hypothetical protein KDE19_01265 [Caldilineaceae bacterium]|nr:hypothetical protein [Caldilineaceae bacterium]